MRVEQFYDKGLAHASYAIISNGEMALIDPARDPQPYYDLAKKENASITAVIETHPHADFISSHLEIARTTGAKIHVSKLLGAEYSHETFDEPDTLTIGKVQLQAINTPGHSPDSISILMFDEKGDQHAVFTGDTLFIGDVGRPDLRENIGNLTAKREELARQMYRSTRDKLMKLNPDTLVYPAHGAGSLCGKALSSDTYSTIGKQIAENYALQDMSEEDFVELLLADQPYIPKYFTYDVSINKGGAKNLEESLQAIPRLPRGITPGSGILVIDSRPAEQFKQGHLPQSINIMDGGKFETWLGSIVSPGEKFYLVSENDEKLEDLIRKTAKIGYEQNIAGAFSMPSGKVESTTVDVDDFRAFPENYTIVDVRTQTEAKDKVFENSQNIPLHELRERVHEVPGDKPVMVHCAAGYRSAAGSSILENHLDVPVYDLGEAISEFSNTKV